MQKSTFKTLALSFVLLVVVASISVYYMFFNVSQGVKSGNVKSSTDNVNSVVSLSVTGENGVTVTYSADFAEGISALDALKNVEKNYNSFKFTYQESSYGAYITGMNGFTPDSKVAFWEFKVNGTSSMVGVSDYKVKSTDQLAFIVTKIDPNYK